MTKQRAERVTGEAGRQKTQGTSRGFQAGIAK